MTSISKGCYYQVSVTFLLRTMPTFYGSRQLDGEEVLGISKYGGEGG